MIKKVTNTASIEHFFSGWQETTIWSALQGIMGEVYAEEAEKPDAAMVILGDFCFFAGEPSLSLVAYKPETFQKDFIIMVPQNQEWARLIEEHYRKKAQKTTRYAIHKNRGNFDKEKLGCQNPHFRSVGRKIRIRVQPRVCGV